MLSSGNNPDMSQDNLALCRQIIETFLRQNNLDPEKQRVEYDPGMGWMATRGSAVVFFLIGNIDGIDSIRIAAPIIYLPQDNLLPLYRRCLELNFQALNCAFAINKDKIVVVSERLLSGLDLQEFTSMVSQVSFVADKFDNILADEFGAKLYSQGQ